MMANNLALIRAVFDGEASVMDLTDAEMALMQSMVMDAVIVKMQERSSMVFAEQETITHQ